MQQQNERFERKGYAKRYTIPDKMRVEPLPDEMQYLWNWCCMASSLTELHALSQLEGIKLMPWEVETVVAVNRLFNRS